MNRIQQTLLLMLVVLCAAGASAQPYRINRHRLSIEGVTFAREPSVSAQNYLHIDDFTLEAGATKTVPVYLTSSMPIWMFQADVVLPSGLTATDVNFSSAFLATMAASQYSVDCGIVDGHFRILTLNTTKTLSIPAGTRQYLFDLTIHADAALTAQTLASSITGFDFVEASSGHEQAYEGESRSFMVTVTRSHDIATDITLSQSEFTTYVGEQTTLTATVTPSTASQAVVWATSKASVATVSQSGVVTAVGEGMAVVTATTTDGSNRTATCIVTVARRMATNISVAPTTASLQVGGTLQLAATVLPTSATDRSVTWRTSNTAVAIVDANGLVSAIGVGEATITATTADGSNLSATCTVTVTPPMATAVVMSDDELSMTVGDHSALTATVLPTTAVQQVAWFSSKPDVATVDDNGIVTAVSDGTAVISATTTDGSNLSATCTVTVTRPQATAVVMSDEELTITVGQHTALTATVLPDAALQQVAWSSSKPAVATVDSDGNITALAAGTTVILATTTDGSNRTGTCILTVKERRRRGDVNYDGAVDVDDMNLVINMIIHTGTDDDTALWADVDGSGVVDVDDLNIVINIMLGKDPYTEYTVNGVTFNMIKVKGGTFTMGATAEQGSGISANEKPPHQVTLSGFAIGETPVTQALWQAVMGNNPSYNQAGGNYPVEEVSWNQCQEFITKLNQITGETFRLPTEAEWEYAARGGNKSKGYKWAGSNTSDDVAWCVDNSGGHTHAVATKAPNELGLYDMSGNVWEPCQDWWGSYSSTAVVNPTGPDTGTFKVIRGGCYNDSDDWARVSHRQGWTPTSSSRYAGLRLAK